MCSHVLKVSVMCVLLSNTLLLCPMSGLHPASVRVPGRGQDREGAGEGRASEGVHPLQRPHRRLPREPQPRHHTRGRCQGETSVVNYHINFFF